MKLFTFVFVFFQATAMAEGLCPSHDLLKNLAGFSGKLLKQANIEYVKTDVADFCRRNMLLRYLSAQRLPLEPFESMPLDQLEKEVDKRNSESAPWQLTLVSTREARQKAVNMTLGGENAKAVFSKVDTPNPQVNAYASNFLQKTMTGDARVASVGQPYQIAALCTSEMPLSLISCDRALTVIKQDFAPKGGSPEVTDRGMWERIADSNEYDEGIRETAITLQKRLDGDFDAKSNVFDDVKNGFLKSGMSAKAAEQAAWDTMGVIGNQAGNIGSFMNAVQNGAFDFPLTRKNKELVILRPP